MRMCIAFVGFAVVIYFSSCSSGGGTDPLPPATTPTAAQLIDQGWQAFTVQTYQAALDKFTAAMRTDSTISDAYNGAGWSNARLNVLSAAIIRFTQGRMRDPNNLGILAGLAIVHNAQKEYALSVSEARSLLLQNSIWAFERDTSVNASDIRLIVAEGYFALASFDSSYATVRVLNPSFLSIDISTIEGKTSLAVEIERLRTVFR